MAEINHNSEIIVGDTWSLVLPVKVFRDFKDGTFDVCDEDGNCFRTIKENLTLKIENNMKAMKDAVATVATGLAKANNTVTTLEIKTELRRDYPYYFWTQDIVSKYMDQLAGDGVFSYTDNGTYRIYSLINQKRRVNGPATVLTKTVKATSANTVSTYQTAIGLKVQKTRIDWQRVLQLAVNPQFTAVTLANGTTLSKSDIKTQKKSPLGYISPKLGRIKSIVVGNTQYNVK